MPRAFGLPGQHRGQKAHEYFMQGHAHGWNGETARDCSNLSAACKKAYLAGYSKGVRDKELQHWKDAYKAEAQARSAACETNVELRKQLKDALGVIKNMLEEASPVDADDLEKGFYMPLWVHGKASALVKP